MAKKFIILGAAALLTAQAQAEMYVAKFSGVVDAGILDERGLFSGAKAGDTASISYFYDTDVVRAKLLPPSGNTFQQMWFIFDHVEIAAGSGRVTLGYSGYSGVQFGEGRDLNDQVAQWALFNYHTYAAAENMYTTASMAAVGNQFYSSTSNIFLNGPMSMNIGSRIPGLPGDPSVFVSGGNPSGTTTFLSMRFTPTTFSIEAAAVPEPATWGLMLAGFGMLGANLRSRRQTRFTSLRSL